jgi:lysophospholipase L1-like esterase
MKNIIKLFLLTIITTLFISSCSQLNETITPLNDYPHWHERMATFVIEKDSIKNGSAIFLGDSIIEGFDLETFFPEMQTVNRGIVSDHIDGLIKRMDVCLGDAENAKLFVSIGINDIGAKRSEKTIKYLYRNMVDQIVENYDYDVYLHSILPTSPRWKNCPPELIKSMNKYIERLAKKKGLTFVNIYPLFKDMDSDYAKKNLLKDGLHPNEAGYKIWADYLKLILLKNN